MVVALGGAPDAVSQGLARLPEAPVVLEVPAPEDGVLTLCDTRALGWAVVGLGGGRMRETDIVDPAVGLSDILPLGTPVTHGQPIARVHAAREEAGREAVAAVTAAFTVGDAFTAPSLIIDEVGP
jgi:thymidine phosphorylase